MLYLCRMKKILKLLRRWHYRRIFRRWYTYYAKRCDPSVDVYQKANTAFFWLACCEEYDKWYAREYWGVNPYPIIKKKEHPDKNES